jgi:hypothetical protein
LRTFESVRAIAWDVLALSGCRQAGSDKAPVAGDAKVRGKCE